MLKRTRSVMPSKLGVFTECPARYIFETEAYSIPYLPLHPRSLLGSEVHRIANILQKKGDMESVSIIQQLECNLITALTGTRWLGTLTAWVQEHYGVAGFVSRKTLHEQIRYAKSLTCFVSEPRKYSSEYIGKRKICIPTGREQLLTSALFNVSGRADSIYQKETGQIRIVEFKTGKVTDELNQPKENHLLQVAAYGVVVKELAPDINVELELVGPHDSWTGFLDSTLNDRVTKILVKLNEVLPLNIPFSPNEIAQPSGHCIRCSSRCSCPVYKEKMLPTQCNDNFFDYDISGKLLAIEGDNYLSDLKIELDNGLVVKVFRIPTQMIPTKAKAVGAFLFLYGLRIFGEKKEGYIPRNFFVFDVHDPKRSAFQFLLQYEDE